MASYCDNRLYVRGNLADLKSVFGKFGASEKHGFVEVFPAAKSYLEDTGLYLKEFCADGFVEAGDRGEFRCSFTTKWNTEVSLIKHISRDLPELDFRIVYNIPDTNDGGCADCKGGHVTGKLEMCAWYDWNLADAALNVFQGKVEDPDVQLNMAAECYGKWDGAKCADFEFDEDEYKSFSQMYRKEYGSLEQMNDICMICDIAANALSNGASLSQLSHEKKVALDECFEMLRMVSNGPDAADFIQKWESACLADDVDEVTAANGNTNCKVIKRL